MKYKLKVYYYVYCASKSMIYNTAFMTEIWNCRNLDEIGLQARINKNVISDDICYGVDGIIKIVENISDPLIRLYWRRKLIKYN